MGANKKLGMPHKILNIAFSGMLNSIDFDSRNELILRIIESMSKSSVRIVSDYKQADFILAYPYGSGSSLFKLKWFIFQIIRKILNIQDCTNGLRWILGVGSKPTLFISHENLDRPYWWNFYGSLLINSKIPRLTYWPKSIDQIGSRFPYWYNYVDWPDYPRPNFYYSRYGRMYSLEDLMSPLKNDPMRKDEAILIASHLDYPRASILEKLSRSKVVKVFGRIGIEFKCGKYYLMREYKYALSCENSVGFGYDSEKIPEAWIAGCIPCGTFLNPYSDFNSEVLYGFELNDNQNAYNKPLLLNKPNLKEIEEYVKNFIEQYYLDNAYLSRRNPIS